MGNPLKFQRVMANAGVFALCCFYAGLVLWGGEAAARTKKKPAGSKKAAATAATAATAPADVVSSAAVPATANAQGAAAPATGAVQGPASLWVSTLTTSTLATIQPDGWNAVKFPFEVSVYAMDRIEMQTPFGSGFIIQPKEGSERPLLPEDAAKIAEILSDPLTYSRELTPEDECSTAAASLGLRYRGDAGIMRIEIKPECNELRLMGFNIGDEPVGELRLGYGPGRARLLRALEVPAKGLVPDHLLR